MPLLTRRHWRDLVAFAAGFFACVLVLVALASC
jgi:hypothetical protein